MGVTRDLASSDDEHVVYPSDALWSEKYDVAIEVRMPGRSQVYLLRTDYPDANRKRLRIHPLFVDEQPSGCALPWICCQRQRCGATLRRSCWSAQ